MKFMFRANVCDYLENVVAYVSSMIRWRLNGCVRSIGYWHCTCLMLVTQKYRWAYVLIIVNWWTFQAKIDKLTVRCWLGAGEWRSRRTKSQSEEMEMILWTFANTITRKLSEYQTYTHTHTRFDWKIASHVSWFVLFIYWLLSASPLCERKWANKVAYE